MTTAVTSTVFDMTSDAAFRTWVQEVITMLFTTLGVTQTADTGQINTATVTRPGAANTSAGYVVGRFNDTLQATAPIFFKLEFGTGTTGLTTPQMWITVGTGSNGSGTITGIVGTRVSAGRTTINSTVTPYSNRGCYSTALGVLWFTLKQGSPGANERCASGFAIYRSIDSTGAPTADGFMLLTNSGIATGVTASGNAQAISNLTGLAYTSSAPWVTASSTAWGIFPFVPSTSSYGGNAQIGPVFQFTPIIGVAAALGLCCISEIPVGSTASGVTLVGSTARTYINAGTLVGDVSTITSVSGSSSAVFGVLALWE